MSVLILETKRLKIALLYTYTSIIISNNIVVIILIMCQYSMPFHSLTTAENVQVIVNSSTQITISWDQPSYQERSAQPLHYRIQICNVTYEQPDCKDQITTGNTYYLNIRLHPYYRYMLTVAAYTSTMGYGPPSEVISIQMPEDGKSVFGNVHCLETFYMLVCPHSSTHHDHLPPPKNMLSSLHSTCTVPMHTL